MMGNSDSKGLAMAMVAVGLAQFAALRPLSTEGIQRRATLTQSTKCVAYMVESGRVNISVAKEYLQSHELHTTLSSSRPNSIIPKPSLAPSTFYFEESVAVAVPNGAHTEERVSLNVAFATLGPRPVHLALTPGNTSATSSSSAALVTALFGSRGYECCGGTAGGVEWGVEGEGTGMWRGLWSWLVVGDGAGVGGEYVSPGVIFASGASGDDVIRFVKEFGKKE
ncbi:hypothetical protein HDU76_000430 [Blyttiomyces sp. JEL0837]|nr:hypothetical protein HDU76_000430 [Blyttiomyces sp. JEL0837]